MLNKANANDTLEAYREILCLGIIVNDESRVSLLEWVGPIERVGV